MLQFGGCRPDLLIGELIRELIGELIRERGR
jgi:hypothetical protein